MPTIGESVSPLAVEKATGKVLASKQDVDVLFDLFRKLEGRVEELIETHLLHDARIDHLREFMAKAKIRLNNLEAGTPAQETDPHAEVKAEIVDLFKSLKRDWKMASGVILANLDVPDSKRRLYQNQIRELSTRGDLIPDREIIGRGGANVNYRLNPDLHPDQDTEELGESA